MNFDKGEIGQNAEDRWSEKQLAEGWVIFPATACENNTGKRGAPSLLFGSKAIAIADFMQFKSGIPPQLTDVKAKTTCSWYREFRRWEHGIDFAAFNEYLEGQKLTSIPLMIALWEIHSPDCPDCGQEVRPIDPSRENPEGKGCRCQACNRVWSKPARFEIGRWLLAWLDDLRSPVGSRRTEWPAPGGRGSKRGEGGWLWPRSAMRKLPVDESKLHGAAPTGTQFSLIK